MSCGIRPTGTSLIYWNQCRRTFWRSRNAPTFHPIVTTGITSSNLNYTVFKDAENDMPLCMYARYFTASTQILEYIWTQPPRTFPCFPTLEYHWRSRQTRHDSISPAEPKPSQWLKDKFILARRHPPQSTPTNTRGRRTIFPEVQKGPRLVADQNSRSSNMSRAHELRQIRLYIGPDTVRD